MLETTFSRVAGCIPHSAHSVPLSRFPLLRNSYSSCILYMGFDRGTGLSDPCLSKRDPQQKSLRNSRRTWACFLGVVDYAAS